MATSQSIHLLLVDYLDSYTYNIPAFISRAATDIPNVTLSTTFDIKRYTELNSSDVSKVAQAYHGVILSAGPGTVEETDDIGDFTPTLLASAPSVPVFGICLGFQAICKAFGGTIRRLATPHHGIVSEIVDLGHKSLGRRATRYHSLEIFLDQGTQSIIDVVGVARNFEDATNSCVMEVKHKSRPVWGVQYHPESIYSENCETVVSEFLLAASRQAAPTEALFQKTDVGSGISQIHHVDRLTNGPLRTQKDVIWDEICIDGDFFEVVKSAQKNESGLLLLDSNSKGEWSFFSHTATANIFRYSLRTQVCRWEQSVDPHESNREPRVLESYQAPLDEVWQYLQRFTSSQGFKSGPPSVPFWGGFLGWFSYELGLAHLGLEAYLARDGKDQGRSLHSTQYDDIYLAWSVNTVAYHRPTRKAYLISLAQDHEWIAEMRQHCKGEGQLVADATVPLTEIGRVTHPDESVYTSRILEAQEHIKAGDSYELCLTACSQVHCPSIHLSSDHHQSGTGLSGDNARISNAYTLLRLYETLRNQSPASYMSCLLSPDTAFLSASPELFLSFDASARRATMKPIKGTLKKLDESGRKIDIAEARKALSTPKVVAENLMIVDLIRNDLARVSDEVCCPLLMHVEELEHMFQLVSTVEAKTRPNTSAWDLLRSSLPPGSMTGAPKRRSCRILQNLENYEPRGLYSGVVGYIDVRGNCRTSVAIRNAIQYPGEPFWRIGAGGAITALSDAHDEWQERQLKSHSVDRIFQPIFEVLETILWDPTKGFRRWEDHMKRLTKTLKRFQFRSPSLLGCDENNVVQRDIPDQTGGVPDKLAHWVKSQLCVESRCHPFRVSLSVDASGRIAVRSKRIEPAHQQRSLMKVRLDPYSTNTPYFDPFVEYKTSFREHYNLARQRAGAKDGEEVLLFRPNVGHSASRERPFAPESGDDILTEGSFTNIAVYNEQIDRWETPESACLRGIECQSLVGCRSLVFGQIRREGLRAGMKIRLMNSVRGCFYGEIA
ncbi:MAG: hypothetical protein Q9162_002306 [Coniocarpon cinnabarinum]